MHFKKFALAAVLCTTSVAQASASDPLELPKEFVLLNERDVAVICHIVAVKSAVATHNRKGLGNLDRDVKRYLQSSHMWFRHALKLGATDADTDRWFETQKAPGSISSEQIRYCGNAGQVRYYLLLPADKKQVDDSIEKAFRAIKDTPN